jgi:hypothetical protein
MYVVVKRGYNGNVLRRVGKRQFACPPVGIVVVSLTGGHDKAVLTAHDGNPAGVELEKIECTAFRSS